MLFFSLGILVTIIAYLSNNWRKSIIFSFLIIALIMSLQDGAGTDYESYLLRFNQINTNQIYISNNLFEPQHETVEYGWGWINKIFSFIGFVPMLIFLCLFESYALYKLLIKFSSPKWYWLSIFYFFFVPNLMAMNMSALRQALSIAFFILGFLSVLDKKIILSVILTFIGALIHQSAVVMIIFQLIIYLILKFKKENKPTNKTPLKLVITMAILYIIIAIFQKIIANNLILFNNLISSDIGRYDEYILEVFNDGITLPMHFYFFTSTILISLAFKGAKFYEKIILSILLLIYITQTIFFSADTFARIILYFQFITIPGISIAALRLKKSYRPEFSLFFVSITVYYATHYMISFMNNQYGKDFANFKFISF